MGAPVRGRLAIAVLLLWGLGVEIGPGLHVAFHELLAHHHHEGDEPEGPDSSPSDLDHGHHSLAHKRVAWLASTPPAVTPVIRVPALAAPDDPVLVSGVACPRTARARGPPGCSARA